MAGQLPPLLPPEETLDGAIGFEIVSADQERAVGLLPVEDRVRQPFGIVHGGAYAAAAESLCSATTAVAVAADGMLAMGQTNATTFLRPVTGGTVRAEAPRRHRGRTSWVWDVDFTDDDGRLCAVSRVTLAVRPLDDG